MQLSTFPTLRYRNPDLVGFVFLSYFSLSLSFFSIDLRERQSERSFRCFVSVRSRVVIVIDIGDVAVRHRRRAHRRCLRRHLHRIETRERSSQRTMAKSDPPSPRRIHNPSSMFEQADKCLCHRLSFFESKERAIRFRRHSLSVDSKIGRAHV